MLCRHHLNFDRDFGCSPSRASVLHGVHTTLVTLISQADHQDVRGQDNGTRLISSQLSHGMEELEATPHEAPLEIEVLLGDSRLHVIVGGRTESAVFAAARRRGDDDVKHM